MVGMDAGVGICGDQSGVKFPAACSLPHGHKGWHHWGLLDWGPVQQLDQHSVTLPHPTKTGAKTVGSCVCGWTVTYGWGGRSDAAAIACDHIADLGQAQSIERQQMDGTIHVIEGLSL